mmetsp:Transcript_18404/g.28229  ORF Transcript_18404/g.28229 Transcript_18404/m.28229 type:complete len:120 (+) Transcript_18404:2711-3070(+)
MAKWKSSRILDVLIARVEERRAEKARSVLVSRRIEGRVKKEVIRKWRTELYMLRLHHQVAVPHCEGVVKPRRTSQAFKALKEYAERKKGERMRGLKYDLYFRDSLFTKAFESLRWYANT